MLKQTMEACQKLYEAGYITYMRTDSKTYAPEFIETQNMDYWYGSEYLHPNVDSFGAQKIKNLKEKGQEKERRRKYCTRSTRVYSSYKD